MNLDPESRAAWMFFKAFDRAPRWIASAPGRVNLMGEHTDYNDGFVLPIAIEQRTAIAADAAPGSHATFLGGSTGDIVSFPVNAPVTPGDPPWSNYVRGVVAGMQAAGARLRGFHAVIESNLPLGGGLSSSAALEVATATLLEAVTGHRLRPIQKALLCQRAEHEFAGVPCGIMDQFMAVLGRRNHLLLLDCRARRGELVPFTNPDLALLIINTNVRHALASGEYARRREQCQAAARTLGVPALRDVSLRDLEGARSRLDPLLFRRARHVVSENERTLEAAHCVRERQWERLGELMYASHASLRDDYEVSAPELDLVVELARDIGPAGGVLGCRMTGGGFGGCAVALVRAEDARGISRLISDGYLSRTRTHASVFVTRPGAGATVIELPRARVTPPSRRQ
jgi:galactokinase